MTSPPSELDALIRAARDLPGPPPDVAARLIERLDAAPAAGAAGAGLGGKATGVAVSKLALVLGGGALLVVGAVLGGGVVAATQAPIEAPAPIQLVIAAPASQPPDPAPAIEPEPQQLPQQPQPLPKAVQPTRRPAPAAAARAEPPGEHSTLEEERNLLEVARSAVVAGAWSQALASVAEHALKFPDGALAEEREAIAIQALAATDRGAAATRAAAFRQRWPTSIFEPVIEKIAPRDGSLGSPQ